MCQAVSAIMWLAFLANLTALPGDQGSRITDYPGPVSNPRAGSSPR